MADGPCIDLSAEDPFADEDSEGIGACTLEARSPILQAHVKETEAFENRKREYYIAQRAFQDAWRMHHAIVLDIMYGILVLSLLYSAVWDRKAKQRRRSLVNWEEMTSVHSRNSLLCILVLLVQSFAALAVVAYATPTSSSYWIAASGFTVFFTHATCCSSLSVIGEWRQSCLRLEDKLYQKIHRP